MPIALDSPPIPEKSVRSMLLGPIMAGTAVLLLVIGVGLYVQYVTAYRHLARSRHAYAVRLCLEALQDYRDAMAGFLRAQATDQHVAGLLGLERSAELAARCAGPFTALNSFYGLTELRFINREGRSLLSLPDAGKPGEYVGWPALDKSLETGGFAGGFAVGEQGVLALRLVIPVYAGERSPAGLTGFVAAAMDVNTIMGRVSGLEGFSVGFMLEDGALAGHAPVGERGGLAPGTLWESPGNGRMFYSSSPGMTPDMVRALYAQAKAMPGDSRQQRFSFAAADRRYVVSVVPLPGFSGESPGRVCIIEDESPLRRRCLLAGLGLLLAGGLVAFAAWSLVSRKLDAADRGLGEMIRALSHGNALFQKIFARSETAFVIIRRGAREPDMANQAALELFDVADAGAIRLDRLIPLEADHPLRREGENGEKRTGLMRLSVRGQTRLCEFSRFSLGDEGGPDCCVLRDITRRAAERDRERKQALFLQTVLDQMPCYVCIKDASFRIIFYNAAFAEFFQCGPKDLIGRTAGADWSEEAVRRACEADRAAFTGQGALIHEAEIDLHGRTTIHSVAKKRVQGPEGEPYIITVGADITEQKEMHRQLERMRVKAEAANLAKGQFLARLGHEIRGPLNTIMDMTRTALQQESGAELRRCLESIRSASTRLIGIIDDILAFSSQEDGPAPSGTGPGRAGPPVSEAVPGADG